MDINKDLVVTNEKLLIEQKEFILSKLKQGEHLYVVFDTETTGKEPYAKKDENGFIKERDRIIELGFIFYSVTSNGDFEKLLYNNKPIIFHEYIDPSNESENDLKMFNSKTKSDPEALIVHGITDDFLKGKESLNGIKLNKPAPVFNKVRKWMDEILCVNELTNPEIKGKIIAIGHNSIEFDNRFLSMEMERDDIMYNPDIEYPRSFESVVDDVWDTMIFMKDLWNRSELIELNSNNSFNVIDNFGNKMKPGYSMSYLAHILNVKEAGRENFHGALLDAEILGNCFAKLIKHPKYLSSPNKLPIPAPVSDFLNNKIGKNYIIPKLTSQLTEENENKTVINLVQTDASLQEGTGTINEYIKVAKDLNIKELGLIDVATLINFIPFYQKCIENDIKPIVGVTFKIESYADIVSFVNRNRNLYNDVNLISLELLKKINIEEKDFMSFLQLNNYNDVNILNNYYVSIYDYYEKVLRSQTSASAAIITKLTNSIKNNLLEILEKTNYKVDQKTIKGLTNQIISETLSSILKIEGIKNVIEFNRVYDYPDLTILANNNDGYDSIKKIITKVQRDGKRFAKKANNNLEKGEFPLLTLDMLKNETNGLSVLVGDFNDLLGKQIKEKNENVALMVLSDLREIFNKKVILDVNTKMIKSDNKMKKAEINYLLMLNDFAEKNGLKGIATHHVSFAYGEDYETHKNKSAILLDQRIDSLNTKNTRYPAQFMIAKEDIENVFSENKNLLSNSFKFSNSINLNIELNIPKLPSFPTPNKEKEIDYFKFKVNEFFNEKVNIAFNKYCKVNNFNNNDQNLKDDFFKKYQERLDYEMNIIIDMGFPGYFLIKQDMINFCKNNNIPVGAGRGSAAGSLVVYCLGITSIDPIEHGLFFERFLNPERKEMPDIDTDITGEDREKVLHYLNNKYKEFGQGYSSAAYIITKSTFSAKSTIKALAKAKKMTVQWQNELSDMIPKTPDITIEESLMEVEKLAYRYNNEKMTKVIIDGALRLESEKRQRATGKHAGGIVVGNLVANSPIEYDGDIPVVQYDKNNIEVAGGVKFDLLGLGTLKIVDLAVKTIFKSDKKDQLSKYGIKVENNDYVNFAELDYYDKNTYKILSDANTSNVFQVESDGMKKLLKDIKPSNIEEVSALVALFRPGPLESGMVKDYINGKNDSSLIHYDHPVLEPILKTTFGAILYQEQVMEISKVMAGYTLGGADKLRKAMGKKKPEEMEKQRKIFIEGAIKNGYDENLAASIFDKMEKFAGYGFNKAHAVCYGDLSYKTALLKEHFPSEYMSAVLSCVSDGNDSVNKIENAIDSAKDSNLKILPPNINESEIHFTVNKNDNLVYGLSGIKGASFGGIIAEREKNGNYKNIEDILMRNNTKNASKSAMEGLIFSGALDLIPLSRPFNISIILNGSLEKRALKRMFLLKEYNFFKDLLSSDKKKSDYIKNNCLNMYSESDLGYNNVESMFNKNKLTLIKESLIKEHETISSYITGHPLDVGCVRQKLMNELNFPNFTYLKDFKNINNFEENEKITIAGVVKDFKFDLKSAKGNTFGKILINDGTSDETFMVFSNQIDLIKNELKENIGRDLNNSDIVGFIGSFKTRLNKNSGVEEKSFNIDHLILPEFDVSVKLNDYANDINNSRKNKYKI